MGYMKRILAVAVLAVGLAACGSGGGDAQPVDVEVRSTAVMTGAGSCMQSPVKAGGSLVLKDSSGKVVATGTTVKTPDTDACDWTTKLLAVPMSDFYTLEDGGGGALGTFNGAAIEDGAVAVDIEYDGSASIS
jgi:hypothetical protein